MTLETLNVVAICHKKDGERWLFLYDSTPGVVSVICNMVLDPDENLTVSDGDCLIAAVESLENQNL